MALRAAGGGRRLVGRFEPREVRRTMTSMTIDTVDLYRRATDEFAARMRRVGDRWSAPTPCTDWDVRALVRHIVEEERWAPPLFAGRTIADVGDSLSGDLLGDDPLRAFERASAAAVEAVRGAGAMERIVHLSFGDVPGTEYAVQLAADHLIHAWDLARAIGADTRLDAEAVGAVRAWFSRMEEAYRSAGAVGPRGALPDGASPQEELLVMFGRTP
jgi:uncharacterized protein (TIGR03086 family)